MAKTATPKLRILRFLAGGGARETACDAPGRIRLESERIGLVQVDLSVFQGLVRDGLIASDNGEVSLTKVGAAALSRLRGVSHPPQTQHADICAVSVDGPSGRQEVLANLAESPLAQLARRKGRDGKPFLDQAEFRAGERLRADYTGGMILPGCGARWEAPIASGRSGTAGRSADLTDFALACRQRVDAAIAAVGPELSGVLIDICCFLKGLEIVEIERGWPVRSGKVVLKTALAALARHYAPAGRASERGIRQWGTDDFRPRLSSR